jgi:hypothetical protein
MFSAEGRKFIEINKGQMVRFLPLGLEVPEDHPDRKRYFSMHFRQRPADYSDIAEIALINPGESSSYTLMGFMTEATRKCAGISKA